MLNYSNMTRWCLVAFLLGLMLFAVMVRFVGGDTSFDSADRANKGRCTVRYGTVR